MGKILVIVESPAKAKTINKILGKDYVVKASLGHVRDLPPKKLGVDPENGFKPEYVNSKGKEKVLKELKAEAKACDQIFLAPDPDREGEAIAWHLKEALKGTVAESEFYRVTYNEITPSAIKKAFGEPRQIDEKKVNAQQARRVLDRLVGYQISPLLWRRVKGGSSAGRVQTVALRLVCEREREVLDFVPEKFWILGAQVAKQSDPKDPFDIKLLKINDEKAEVKSLELADRIRAELDNRKLRVDKITRKEVSRRPQAPFITSTLQQAGSSFFGFTPKRTMGLAQKLYEGINEGGGLITYMRTDSVNLAADAVASCRDYVRSKFGDDFIPTNPHFFKSKSSAQEAHEAIRPTDITHTPEALKGILGADEYKLYELIWRRTVASQMSAARIAQLAVDVDAYRADGAAAGPEAETHFLFRANASEVVFPGYMKVYSPGKEDKDTVPFPPLQEQENLDCLQWLEEEKETQPPPRYSEASLIRALEENGVGRPSTYASTIGTITDREYVEKENRSLKPTEVGFKVHDFLIGNLSALFDVKFTAYMEEELDEIEEGKIEWTSMLDEFYTNFRGWIDAMRGKANDKDHVRKITDLFAPVVKWDPPTKRGKRTFSDEKFIQDVIKALDDEKKQISVPQLDVLKRMVCHYREQIEGFGDAMVEEYELQAALAEELKPKEPPRETTLSKLALLKEVQYAEPRTVGKRTYDDKAFCESLGQQVEGGKRLSEKQVQFLDRLLTKYADQIPDFEKHREALGMDQQEDDNESGPLLDLAVTISEWNPPVQRGKRTWSDEEFHGSLKEQFERNKRLSERQRATLKKLLGRYADQIPAYKDSMEALDLPEPKAKKPAKKKAAKKKASKKKAAKKKPAKKDAAKPKARKQAADPDAADPEAAESGS